VAQVDEEGGVSACARSGCGHYGYRHSDPSGACQVLVRDAFTDGRVCACVGFAKPADPGEALLLHEATCSHGQHCTPVDCAAGARLRGEFALWQATKGMVA
jgi:hypothetical protein